MALRHQIAVKAHDVSDLKELAAMLTAAVDDARAQMKNPHVDPACMVISYQIAFAGNGDVRDFQFYRDMHDFCEEHKDDPNPEELYDGQPIQTS